MFDSEFYPTPESVALTMIQGFDLRGKTVLEPSAGKGDLVNLLNEVGANVLTCEKNSDLAKIVSTKSTFLKADFFNVKSEEISHINYIFMNPPFRNADRHILHAYDISPAGCTIVALLNAETLKNSYSQTRREFKTLVENFGFVSDLGACFSEAERKTGVNVAMVTINKPGQSYENEFEGFFLDDEPEEQANGILQYDFIRDIVNRYVAAVKIFDKQLTAAVEMNRLTYSFYSSSIALSIREGDKEIKREEYKKDLQKNAWKFIFNKLNLNKYATRGLREDINKFVENQQNIPFTMRNIYRMLEIVHGTRQQRFDKAIIEVFDKITAHHAENRHNVKGWKTNSHFLVGKKFILPYAVPPAKEYGATSSYYHSLRIYDFVSDLEKALCFITGENWDQIKGIEESIKDKGKFCYYGEWFMSHFFKFKGFKNGNMHFEFISEDVWGLFNQNVAIIKGFPLFEYKKQTAYQERQTGRTNGSNNYDKPEVKTTEAKVLFTFKKQG